MKILENMKLTPPANVLGVQIERNKKTDKIAKIAIATITTTCCLALMTGGALWYSQLYSEKCPAGFSFNFPCISTGLLKVTMLGTAICLSLGCMAGAVLPIALKNSKHLNPQNKQSINEQIAR